MNPTFLGALVGMAIVAVAVGLVAGWTAGAATYAIAITGYRLGTAVRR